MDSGPQRLLLDRVVAVVSADERIEAVLGVGSLAIGGFDGQSDFDFVVVGDVPGAERRALAGMTGTLLLACTGEHVGERPIVLWACGKYLEAISTLDFFRSMVLGPMLQHIAG